MKQFLSIISDIRVVIAIIILVVILTIWLIVTKIRTKHFRKALGELEKRYTDIKGIPLSLKVNKASAISSVDEETIRKAQNVKRDHDSIKNDLKEISEDLALAEDHIIVGKLGKADKLMKELEKRITESHTKVKALDDVLDEILARETAQRQEVTSLKNRFRALKSQAQENASRLSFMWPALEQKISDTEKMFNTFEEWMISSDFDKANAELDIIRSSMKNIDETLEVMPDLLENCRGVLPHQIEALQQDYTREKNRGVYMKHLKIEENVSVLVKALKEDLKKLKAGKFEGVAENLEDYKLRVYQMSESVHTEGESYNEMRSLVRQIEGAASKAETVLNYLTTQTDDSLKKFGYDALDDLLAEKKNTLLKLNVTKPLVVDEVRRYSTPASETVVKVKELIQGYTALAEELTELRSGVDNAASGEDRAKKQLVKLQIITNQMRVKVRKYKLPNISETYEEDMTQATEMIESIQKLLSETPINFQILNQTLQSAVDFVYRLFNNVNNVVGTVVMVENTIVFGNRYRSTYPDIDNELTRSELYFRNGEYTQALTTAIATIEKIHPGNYESMIKENAKGAA